jgi:hypothetical protein
MEGFAKCHSVQSAKAGYQGLLELALLAATSSVPVVTVAVSAGSNRSPLLKYWVVFISCAADSSIKLG